ncbi:hypothetical protein R16034_00021 [Ralstonia edaphis]|uniref:Preprotein translocase subunit SecA n=1 Tax=Ralstonia edaphi TaxID=3058599 RepID=A0AB72WVZ9_9RALS|nr:SEC-C metal-binding domain-containing protein [Ralstonia sp. LMG 6871]CAJ0734844.1 hypothetical protein R16034_00021 [Ralstonia sp. LMG 6871]
MGKRNKRPLKPKRVAADEAYSYGSIELSRFGNKVLFTSHRSESAHAALMDKLATKYPLLVEEIDQLVNRITSAVSVLPPSQLMQRAWWAFFMISRDVTVEADVGQEQAIALRMIDYVQSVIAATPRGMPEKTDLSEQDWVALRKAVAELYQILNLTYPACYTAYLKKTEPAYSPDMDELLVRTQLQWCNVRGDYYQVHQVSVLLDLLRPQSALIEAAYGISAERLVAELEKIWHALTFGIHNAAVTLDRARTETMAEVQSMIEQGQDVVAENSVPELIRLAAQKLGHEEALDSAVGMLFGMDLFDVGKMTSLPVGFLDDFSWEPGQETEFLAAGEMRGWPLRIQPIFRRPFLKLDGTYYCFDLHSLFDNFFRQMEKRIFQRSEQEKQTWISNRKDISESLPVQYFSRLLPGAQVLRELYYPLQAGEGKAKTWYEADCAIAYDDLLFIIEVKAGAFTYTSPANDLPAYVSSLQALLGAPGKQGQRFLTYLESATEVEVYDAKHNPVGTLRRGDFRSKIICTITLDPFTELAARAQHLSKVGIDAGDVATWPISLADLCVYADVFEGPLDFLHFVEQRMRAANSGKLDLDDELDHLGLYLEHNNYALHADDIAKIGGTPRFHGYRSAVDRYYAARLRDHAEATPPAQAVPARLRQIIDFLSATAQPHRSRIASYLLDLDGAWREDLSRYIDEELLAISDRGRCLPISSYGNVRMTVFISIANAVETTHEKAVEHAQTVMIVAGEVDRELVELTYEGDAVQVVKMTHITLVGLSAESHDRLAASAAHLKERRLARSALELGKIGRNDLCPCGSGKKFKRCCMS